MRNRRFLRVDAAARLFRLFKTLVIVRDGVPIPSSVFTIEYEFALPRQGLPA
jgi:hypothetical protein